MALWDEDNHLGTESTLTPSSPSTTSEERIIRREGGCYHCICPRART